MARTRPGGISDPYSNAPAYPKDAEFFVFNSDGGDLATSIAAVVSHAGDELEADRTVDQITEVRRRTPDYAETMSNSDSIIFPAGEPIPRLFVHEHVWRVNYPRLVALDGEGRPLDAGRDESEEERVARQVAPKIAGDDEDDEDRPDPLAGVTSSEIDDMEYAELRRLASKVKGIDGNGAAEQIRADLLAALDDEDDENGGDSS